jgi:hypothetical protein
MFTPSELINLLLDEVHDITLKMSTSGGTVGVTADKITATVSLNTPKTLGPLKSALETFVNTW